MMDSTFLANQAATLVFAGPDYGGSAAVPTFRSIQIADIAGAVPEISLLHPKYGITVGISSGGVSTANTAGIQQWLNDVAAVNGIGIVPPVSNFIYFNGPVTLQPQSGAVTVCVELRAYGNSYTNTNVVFQYIGTSPNAFIFLGTTFCTFRNISVVPSSATSGTGLAVLDQQFTDTLNSSGYNAFINCYVDLEFTTKAVGFRIGQFTDGASNAPWTQYIHCTVNDTNTSHNNIGYQIGGSQAYGTRYIDCSYDFLALAVLNGPIATTLNGAITSSTTPITVASTALLPNAGTIYIPITMEQINYVGLSSTQIGTTSCTRGANGTMAAGASNGSQVNLYVSNQGSYTGSSEVMWIGGGGTGALFDFLNDASGAMRVMGARFEHGQRLYQAGVTNANYPQHAEFSDCQIATYTSPSDNNGCVWLHFNTTFALRNSQVYNNSSPFSSSAPFITNNSTSTSGRITIDNCDLYAQMGFLVNTENWLLHLRCQLTSSSGIVASVVNQNYEPPIVLTDVASVTLDVSLGTKFYLPMTSAVGSTREIVLTNANLGMPPIQLYLVQPASGGPCSATWGGDIPGTSTPLTYTGTGGNAVPSPSSGASAIDLYMLMQPVSGTILVTKQ